MRFRVLREIAERNVLSISDEIDETERRFVQHAQESRGTAPVLDVGLAF